MNSHSLDTALTWPVQTAHSTKRRDDLLSWQTHYQSVWEEERVFEANAPTEGAWRCPGLAMIS